MTWTARSLPGTPYTRRLARRRLINGQLIAVEARFHNRHTYNNHRCECEICAADYHLQCAERWANRPAVSPNGVKRRAPHQSELMRRA